MSKSKYTNKKAERITDILMYSSLIERHNYDKVYELIRTMSNESKYIKPSTGKPYTRVNKRKLKYAK